MCDSADGQCDVWDVTYPTARKAHRCDACPEPIEPGHKYARTAMLYDGNWSHMRHCLRCSSIFKAIQEKNWEAGEIVGIDPGLNCGDSWVDVFGEPPPEVAALAFILPGEQIATTSSGGEGE